MTSLTDSDIFKKKIIIRVDMNVPIKNGQVLDSTRIVLSLPSIKYCISQRSKVLLITHFGRPTEGEFDNRFSVQNIVKEIENNLGQEVEIVKDLDNKKIFNSNQNVQILENVRFFKGEKDNCEKLGKKIADLCDLYVFDAFGCSHRKNASTYSAIIKSKKACMGLLMEKELINLNQALLQGERPYLSIIGGSKVSTKLELIENIIQKADKIIVGGGIANTFLKASGFEVGNSLHEPSMVKFACKILEQKKIVLPKYVFVSKSFDDPIYKLKKIDEVDKTDMILDIYFSKNMKNIVMNAKTIIWNGPMGVFENENYKKGTEVMAKAIALSPAFKVAGGGETVSAISKFIHKDDVSYLSTGGGAFLEFMEGKTLPAFEALKNKNGGDNVK
jgi:phosphoglycerate kinase